jgi:hypothetical protein
MEEDPTICCPADPLQLAPLEDFMTEMLTPPHDQDEKSRWEIAKLRAEVHALNRAPYKNPSLFLAGLTALVGMLGIGIQYAKSDNAYQLAEIKRQQASLEIAQLAIKRSEADSLLTIAVTQLQATSARRAEQERKLAAAESALVSVQQALSNSSAADNPGVAVAVRNATALVQEAGRNSQVATQEAQSTIQDVQQLRSEFQAPGTRDSRARSTIVVTGGFGTIAQARRDANATQAKGYPASVYHRHNQYRTAIAFSTREAARAALPEIREQVRSGAYLVDLNEWCLGITSRDDHFVCQDGDPERVVQ